MTTFSTWHCLCNMIPGVAERTLSAITHYIFTYHLKKFLRVPVNMWIYPKLKLTPPGWSKCCDVGSGTCEFGGQRHDRVHHLQGPSQEEEEDISNITARKRPKANTFHPFTILLWTMRCYSESLFIPQVDNLVKTSERSLLASFSAFLSVGNFYSVTIMIWNTYFWCAWERKEGWIKYDKTAILALVDNYSRILHVKM